jgi:hypothetical protein
LIAKTNNINSAKIKERTIFFFMYKDKRMYNFLITFFDLRCNTKGEKIKTSSKKEKTPVQRRVIVAVASEFCNKQHLISENNKQNFL